ncbi:MAG: FixH family protein [Myxococcaceae bacterium]
MRWRSFSWVFVVAFAATLSTGCGAEPVEDGSGGSPFGDAPLARAQSGGFSLELFTRGPLEVGRNEVAYRLVDAANDQVITRATLTQKPMMTMAMHSHSCPLSQPRSEADADGRFLGTIVPIMPSGDMGTWSLQVEAVPEGSAGPLTFDFGHLQVAERALPARKDLVVGEDEYVVTVNFPAGAPEVGSQDIIVTVHQSSQLGLSWPAQTDLTVVMTPEMPTMGHGSSGNVAPAHAADGEYRGVLNLNMAGAWRVTFELMRGGTSLGTVVYDFDV